MARASSSGGGWRNVTSTGAHPSSERLPITWAKAPAVQPPLPEAGGPQNRAGMVSTVAVAPTVSEAAGSVDECSLVDMRSSMTR